MHNFAFPPIPARWGYDHDLTDKAVLSEPEAEDEGYKEGDMALLYLTRIR
jgi:hypothetical protein